MDIGRWIRQLIQSGRLHSFYLSAAWLHKRSEVLERQHHECQRCRTRGVYAMAVTVHHRKYLRRAPEIALEDTNLEALCSLCHYEEHHGRRALNEEKW